jgi:hypothetical protein
VILIVLAALCIISVPITGGNLGRLAELRLRWLWTAPVALILQTVIVTVAPGGSESLHAAAHIVSYALVGAFLWANRHVAGAHCPRGAFQHARRRCQRRRDARLKDGPAPGRPHRGRRISEFGGGLTSDPALAGRHHPRAGPLPNVMSVGDCIIFAGLLVLLHRQCRPRATLQPA